MAGFAELMRNSAYIGDVTINRIITQAEDSIGYDWDGYRREFIDVARMYRNMVN